MMSDVSCMFRGVRQHISMESAPVLCLLTFVYISARVASELWEACT